MKTSFHKTAILAAALLSMASATQVAFAQISVQSTVDAHATTGNIVTGGTHASVNAGANDSAASSSSSADHRMNATVTGGINADHASVNADMHASQNSAVQAALDADAAMTQTLKASDANVAAVTTDQDSVTVAYKVPAHFLGIFPVHVKALVTTDASGKTKVHYPWYDFATSVQDDASLKAQLEARNWSVNAQNKAQIAASIQATLKAWLSSRASVSATTTASVNAQ
jgi:hypothetical protein